MIDALRLIAGWALPWLLGIALVASLQGRADRAQPAGEAAWTIGCGFFVGAFVLTLWMRALSMLGLRFSVAAVGPAARRRSARARGPRLAQAARVERVARTCRIARRIKVGRCSRSARVPRAARPGVRHRRMDGAAPRPAAARSAVDPALPLGRVDPVGDQGTRLVRAWGASCRSSVPIRGSRRTAPLVRRGAQLSRHRAAVAGLVEPRARPLGRRADEPALVAASPSRSPIAVYGALRCLRSLGAHRARRHVARLVAAARQRARRARRLRRSADGRVLRAGSPARCLRWTCRAAGPRPRSRCCWRWPARRSRRRASCGR